MEQLQKQWQKNAWNEACMQEHLFGGFLGNVSIALIDKTDGKDPKRVENYWIRTLKTYVSFGLNIEDSIWPIPCRSMNVTGGLTCLASLTHWLEQERI